MTIAPPTTCSADAGKLYGQIHPVETPELIGHGQAALQDELEKLSSEKKQGWLKAKEKCPDIVNDEQHTLLFLRCEVFNADLAALRLAKYWDKRIEIFGESQAFQPLVLSTLSPDIDAGLSLQFLRLTQTSDTGNRSILYAEIARLMGGYNKSNDEDRARIARAVWYTMHVALEDEMTQRVGMVFLVNYNNTKASVVDRKLMGLIMGSINGCLPIRIGAFHVCHPPWFFGKLVFPIIKMMMSERMKKRFVLHNGSSQEKILKQFEDKYGLSCDVLPSELGGKINFDTEKWIKERKNSGL